MRLIRLWCIMSFFLLTFLSSVSAASSMDAATARYLGTQDGRMAYVRAIETYYGAAGDDGAGKKRVERLLLPLTQTADRAMPLVIVTSNDSVNAYALPGAIVVHAGMLAFVKDDDELSVFLAHELGHLALDHPLRGIRRSMRARYFARRAAKADSLDDGAKAFVQAARHADLGLHEEREADVWAAQLLPRAGVSSEAAVRLWVRCEDAGIGGKGVSHPSYEERKRIYGGDS